MDFIILKLYPKSIFFILLICLILNILNFSAIAEEEQAEISIKGIPTYELVSQNKIGNNIVSRYNIFITFENKGNINSDLIKVNLSDSEDFNLNQDITIKSLQTKIITFNWSTIYTNDQQLEINYFPADLDAIRTKYNSGKTTFTIKIIEGNGSNPTPGFEIAIIGLAIIIYVFLRTYRK